MKNQITFLIIIIVLGFCNLQAQVTQEWIARYNGPNNSGGSARLLEVDASENVYVTGVIIGSGVAWDRDYATIKYNSSGDSLWVAIYNGPGDSRDAVSSLEVDESGNVYITGSSNSSISTIKYNSSGVQQWVQRYDCIPVGFLNPSLAVDDSGNVYVAGYNNGIATIKYNSSGVQQWVQIYNGLLRYKESPQIDGYIELFFSIVVTGSGNVYVTGTDPISYSDADYVTIKYNSSGTEGWVQRYNGPESRWDDPRSIAVDDSENVYVTGNSFSNATGFDHATIKYSPSGVQQWIQIYNGAGGYSISSIAVDRSKNVYVTGGHGTIKYNSSGVQQWIQNPNGYDERSLGIDGLGNVYITARTDNHYGTIKYNATGVQQWIQIYSELGNSDPSSLVVDGSGNVYVTGGSNGEYATIKYSQTEGITAPSHLKAQSIDSSFIKLTWQDNSNDEAGFYIERTQINDSSHWEVIDVVPQNANEYSDYFVTRGLEYFYRVKAYSGNIYSEYSNIDSAILGGDPSFIPAPPSKLVLLKRTANTIIMDWRDNSSNENGFIIFRKTEEDLFFEIIDSVSTDVVTYQEVGVNPNLNYSYKICSYNSAGISDYSNTLIILSKSGPFIKTSELSGNPVLSGNYPNPFNPKTIINYQIPPNVKNQTSDVKLIIYNILGKEIVTLVSEKQNAATYSVEWDAGNYPSGIYFYRIEVGNSSTGSAQQFIQTKRMVLIK